MSGCMRYCILTSVIKARIQGMTVISPKQMDSIRPIFLKPDKQRLVVLEIGSLKIERLKKCSKVEHES